MVCQLGECNITSVETGDLAGHTCEPLLLFEEVVKAEGVALGAFAVHAHTRLFHAKCHEQDDHQYHEGNGQH